MPSGARQLRERLRAARPMLAGRPHEAASNGSPRWMAAGPRKRVHRTRPTGRLARRLTWADMAASGHAGVAGYECRRPGEQPVSRRPTVGDRGLGKVILGAESACLGPRFLLGGGGSGPLGVVHLPSGFAVMPARPDRVIEPTGCASARFPAGAPRAHEGHRLQGPAPAAEGTIDVLTGNLGGPRSRRHREDGLARCAVGGCVGDRCRAAAGDDHSPRPARAPGPASGELSDSAQRC